MKIIYSIATVSILLATSYISKAQEINPITQAMFDGYEQILSQNPSDYFTLYQRSAQYYRLSSYDNALADIQKAITATPAKDKDMLTQEYSLAADIYMEMQQYPQALETIEAALSISPTALPLLYKKGNICLYLEDYTEAKKSFATMQRLQPRLQESYFGLAKVALVEGDTEKVTTLIKEAENCDPSNYITYCRLGDLYTDMGDYSKAATSYLSAFGLADKLDRPINSIINLSKKDYKTVANAIDYGIAKTDNTVPLYFLKGNIAAINGRYSDAYASLRTLADTDNPDPSVCSKLSEVCVALDKIPEALRYAEMSISNSPKPDYLIVKSKAEIAAGAPDKAITSAAQATKSAPGNSTAFIALAQAYISNKQYEKALEALNEAILIEPSSMLSFMLRANLYSSNLNNHTGAVEDYVKVTRMQANSFPEIAWQSLARTLSGKKLDGDAYMAKALANSKNPDELFWGAVYYSQTGDLDQASKFIDKAIDAGYDNEYNLRKNEEANLNIKPIRHLLK